MANIDDVLAVAQAQAGVSFAEPPEPPEPPATSVDTYEEPRLWPEIRMMIETGIRDQPREKQAEIGPSELGSDCLHCLAAKLAGWPQSRKTSWLPFIGTCVHEHFEREFRNLGLREDHECPDGQTAPRFETEMRVKVGTLSGIYGTSELHGSIDLYDRKTHSTVDWKITGDTTMKAAKANGPSQQYRVQASLYGIGLENAGEKCERNCIFMLPRNKTSLNDAYAWEVPFDPKPGRWAMSRAQLLINLMDCIELADGPEVRDAPVVSGLRPHADARPAQTVRVARPIACVAGRDRASRRPPAHARQPAERAHADPARRARPARHDRRHGTRHVATPRRRGRARLAA